MINARSPYKTCLEDFGREAREGSGERERELILEAGHKLRAV